MSHVSVSAARWFLALVVKTRNQEHTDLLLRQGQFLGKPATFSATEELIFVEAYAYAPAAGTVQRCSQADHHRARRPRLVGVRRLRPKKTVEKNPGIRICIRRRILPAKLRVGYDTISLGKWQSSPKLCRRCSNIGHTAASCQGEELRTAPYGRLQDGLQALPPLWRAACRMGALLIIHQERKQQQRQEATSRTPEDERVHQHHQGSHDEGRRCSDPADFKMGS